MHSDLAEKLGAPRSPLHDAIAVTDRIFSSRVLPQPIEKSWGVATISHWPLWIAFQADHSMRKGGHFSESMLLGIESAKSPA
jgi:hypothetical protein